MDVLVDTITPPRSHDHDHDPADAAVGDVSAPTSGTPMSGRTPGNKLVHVVADARLLGREVRVHIEHAGPYALRGRLVSEEPPAIR